MWTSLLQLLVIPAALVVLFALAILPFLLRRWWVRRAVEGATEEELEAIYRRMDALGGIAPNGFVLARTNRRAGDARTMIPLPEIADFPWSGRTVGVEVDGSREFPSLVFLPGSAAEAQLLGRVYRTVAIPRRETKSGKARNSFALGRYVGSDRELREALEQVCPWYSVGVLNHLLEPDPVNQARIGASASWLQRPEFPKCPRCKQSMRLIVQLPGSLAIEEGWQEFNFYLLGCGAHPEEITTVYQCS